MTTRKKSTEADSDQDVQTAGVDQSKTDQTSTEAREQDPSTTPEASGETDVEGAASGEVAGGVVRGDTGLDESEFEVGGTEVPVALGTVQEVSRSGEAVDAPWKYLDGTDFDEVSNVRTSDSDDPAKSWTVQETEGDGDDEVPVALVPVQAVPGQTFRADELPNVEVMRAAGIDPVQFLSGLPVRADVEDEAPRRGIPA